VSVAIRPYEISVWTLQDSFIAILKDSRLNNKVFLEAPEINVKNDGTQELTFSVPMYYRENEKLIENPLWWDIKDGLLTANLRKLKVIFHKGESEKEEIYEFVIDNISETHSGGKLQYELIATGLAFQELGKRGYKISLNQFTFENEYNKWLEKEEGKEPIPNLNFWADRIFENSNWTYSIQMDWSYIDGVIGERDGNVRQPNKIYEEEYTTSWEEQSGQLVPTGMEPFKEKARIVEIDKSNIYNATQTLAETFGVYCKYKYHYDSNYHIIKRECIFYNSFLNDKEKIDINYPYDAKSIKREIDSTDVITKLFVTPIESESAPGGLITIADVPANKSGEDYILNFDYLYSIGTISEEQYQEIKEYEKNMFLINSQLKPLEESIAKLETDLIKYQAEKTIALNAQSLAKEQMEQATALLDSITDGKKVLQKIKDNPYRAVLIPDTINSDKYYIKITQEGVLDEYKVSETQMEKIRVWYRQDASTALKDCPEYTDGFSIERDNNGNITGLRGITLLPDSISETYYLTFYYRPALHYENVYNTFSAILSQNEIKEQEAVKKIEENQRLTKEKRTKYDELIQKKKNDIAFFENLMGPALREGSWQAEDLKDYGTKYNEEVSIDDNSSSLFVWDENHFDEEQLGYYQIQTEENGIQNVNYFCIQLTDEIISKIKENDAFDKISFIYDYNKELGTFQQMNIGAEAQYVHVKTENGIVPAIILLDINFTEEDTTNSSLGIISTLINREQDGGRDLTDITMNIITLADRLNFIEPNLVYPRFKIDSLLLKTSEDELVVSKTVEEGSSEFKKLKNFYDYSVLIRDKSYFITLKNQILIEGNKDFKISYSLSNAALHLYLDALEVSKTNAFPKTTYEVEISAFNKDFISQSYNYLNRVISINDTDLKFNDVQGYISEISLKLNTPWEDSFVVQNYRNKFEDLFSSIVASTEAMKSNSYVYGMAAGAFLPNGALKPSIIQNAISDINLTYAFQNGNLTIDEENGIWATSDDGIVAMRGGGIFCSNKTDSYGNRIWNTGILPSGINASLITAGQLDTNLIKVYAGDNLRFQLNGDGLFAYGKTATGDTDFSSYVVHNEDGLFLTQNNINKVEVSWDGFIIRDNTNKKVFYADASGNLVLEGQITASTGSIGGWEIQSDGLRSKNNDAGLISSPVNSTSEVFWVNGLGTNNEFKVTADGTMYANNVIVKGFISGSTSSEELDNQLRAISFTVLQGTTFTFDNSNYDGNLIISPEYLYFRINTNALTQDELTDSDYKFYYRRKEEAPWEEIKLDLNESPISFNSQYLTLTVKSDIMYLGLDNAFLPNSVIYLKVEKAGQTREKKIDSSEFNYTEHTYSAEIQLVSQQKGIGKKVSEISPQSHTFIFGEDFEKELSVILEGFNIDTDREELENSTWLINGEGLDDSSDFALVGMEPPHDGKIKAFIRVKPGIIAGDSGSATLTFKIGSAQRTAYCFKNKTGAEGFSMVLRSTSGTTLVTEDTETNLSIEVYYGKDLVNVDENNSFYYVWKKDGNSLTSLKTSKENEEISASDEEGKINEIFFKSREIYVNASNFGLKAVYDCYVFTTLEEAVNELGGGN
jgi:hypothetical protein